MVNNLLKKIDPSKYYFYKSDILEFFKHKHKIDDYENQKTFL